ncbi:uncharacterized protein BDV17DRAFT_295364 [Aspergillus undulatus]|uniref:uncharacterized protein n=1 Tax=Aspergillus undulatus TaxID=1810928 RepID=UPI003CCD3AAC
MAGKRELPVVQTLASTRSKRFPHQPEPEPEIGSETQGVTASMISTRTSTSANQPMDLDHEHDHDAITFKPGTNGDAKDNLKDTTRDEHEDLSRTAKRPRLLVTLPLRQPQLEHQPESTSIIGGLSSKLEATADDLLPEADHLGIKLASLRMPHLLCLWYCPGTELVESRDSPCWASQIAQPQPGSGYGYE